MGYSLQTAIKREAKPGRGVIGVKDQVAALASNRSRLDPKS
jgi:hypothetical protein